MDNTTTSAAFETPTPERIYHDEDLRYSATARCPCGAGLAYPIDLFDPRGAWDCADILTGRAVPKGLPGAKTHTARLPFAFYDIRSEDQSVDPARNTQTTRPRPLTDAEQARRAAKLAAIRHDALERQRDEAAERHGKLCDEFFAARIERDRLWKVVYGTDWPIIIPDAGPAPSDVADPDSRS